MDNFQKRTPRLSPKKVKHVFRLTILYQYIIKKKIMRIKSFHLREISLSFYQPLSTNFSRNVCTAVDQSGEFVCGYWGLKLY